MKQKHMVLHPWWKVLLTFGEVGRWEDVPDRCPTCESPQPNLHPSMGHGGEVQPCRNGFHKIITSQNRESPSSASTVKK